METASVASQTERRRNAAACGLTVPLLFLLALLVTSCGGGNKATSGTAGQEPERADVPVAAPPAAETQPVAPAPVRRQGPGVLDVPSTAGVAPLGAAIVLRVVDVTTLDVIASGDIYRVRLAAIGLPAVQGVVGCYGDEAQAFTASLVPPGSSLSLESAHETAIAGSPVALFARLDGELINTTIVEAGYALVSEVAADAPHRAELLAAERQAARSVAGLWGAGVADHRERDGLSCESLSGYFSGTHVGVSGGLPEGGVPYRIR